MTWSVATSLLALLLEQAAVLAQSTVFAADVHTGADSFDAARLAQAISARHAKALASSSSNRAAPSPKGLANDESLGTSASLQVPATGGVYVAARGDGALLAEAWSMMTAGASDSALVHQGLTSVRDAAAASDASVKALEVCVAYDFRDADLRQLGKEDAQRGLLGVELKLAGETRRYAPTNLIARNLGFDDLLRGSPTSTRVFDATQYYINLEEPQTIRPMFRANEYVDMSEITDDRICELARTMGDWLVRQVSTDGRMTYKYWPSRAEESSANNMIRQFMATQCLARFAADPIGEECEYRQIASTRETTLTERAVSNLRYNMQSFYEEEIVSGDTLGFVVETDDEVKLGAVALAALAILESPVRAEFRREERALRRTIDSLYQPDGSFQTFYRPATRTGGENFYTGEALLYWAELFTRDIDKGSGQLDPVRGQELLDRFLTSVRYYQRWHLENRNPAFVPWHTQACFRVWQTTRDPFLAKWIFTMNDWLLGMQQWNEAPYADMRGRFYAPRHNFGPPHASSTGVYLEGLADAFVVARELEDNERAEAYRAAILRGIRNIAQLQFTDDLDMFYVVDRAAVEGGIRTTEYDNEIRVDNVQHVLMALLDVLSAFTPADVARPLPPMRAEGMGSRQVVARDFLRTALRPPSNGAAGGNGATARSDPSPDLPDSP